MSSQLVQCFQRVVMDGVPPLFHLFHGHGKAHCKAFVQVFPHDLAQFLHAVEVAVRLNVVGEIEHLFQHRHTGLTRRVPENGVVDLVVRAEHVARERRAGLGVQQLERLFLQLVEFDVVVLAERELLVHRKALGRVVQERRKARLFNICAVAFREFLRRLLGAEHVGNALRLEVGERDGSQFL